MTLLDSMMESFTILDKVSSSDGEGGMITTWKDGASIRAVATLDNSMQSRLAEAQGVTSVYTITTARTVILGFHDVLRRESDGQVFRVTSNAKDKKTPKVAGIDMAQCSAEAWVLPSGGAND